MRRRSGSVVAPGRSCSVGTGPPTVGPCRPACTPSTSRAAPARSCWTPDGCCPSTPTSSRPAGCGTSG
ncbi:hypothetical protein [Ornithinimicrobium kibberense]|uniref:hypothetical protein n=1 Tax=Ornithinimicrobium kibberense TaxID=282060 RepID=UPI003619AA3A